MNIPSYRRHTSGLGVVTIAGRDIYLGKHNTPESRAAYGRVIAEWLATGSAPIDPNKAITVREAIERFRAGAGLSAKDAYQFRYATDPLVALYGNTCLADFGPVRMRAVQEQFVRLGWSRRVVNRQCGRVRQALKWLVAHELFDAGKLAAIREVPGLRAGKTTAPERPKVQPVDESLVLATLPYLPRPVRGIVLLQLHTGCRPGEAVIARRRDVDTEGVARTEGKAVKLEGVWVYSPRTHKTAWRGSSRFVLIGPKGQAALEEFLVGKDAADALFPPSEVAKAPRPGEHYTTQSYGRAILAACRRGKLQGWHPYQLRHAFLGKIRDLLTSEHAKEVAGHKHLDMTDHYTGASLAKAAEAIRKAG